MDSLLNRIVWKAKLFCLWWRRIIFASDHFGHNPLRKIWLALRGGYTLDQYYLYDFAHNDRRDYLSEFDWYRSRNINKPYDMMLNNKVIATEVLGQYIQVPPVFMQKNRGKMVWLTDGEKKYGDLTNGTAASTPSSTTDASDVAANGAAVPTPSASKGYCQVSDALQLLRQEGSLFMKPLAAGKGKDVFRLEWDAARSCYRIDGDEASEEEISDFLTRHDGWFLSGEAKQGAFASSLYPHSGNTIRFITLRDPETGLIRPFVAVQRIGTDQTAPVDNGSRGGLVCHIDMETGELSEAKCLQRAGTWERHPDTGAQLKGRMVPDWDQLKATMVGLHQKLPFMNFIAWDVLLTDEGPCIIEANTSSGPNIIQLWGPQRNGELGDFYRFYGCIK